MTEKKEKVLKKEKEVKGKEPKPKKNKYTKPINSISKNIKERIAENIDTIIQLRKEGNTIEHIAKVLGVCKSSFYNHLNSNEELLEALQRGQYEYNIELKKSAMQRALGFKIELKKTKKEYKINEYGGKEISREVVDVEEKYIYSDLLAYKLLNLDKYNNVDEVPAELKELFEKYSRKAEDEN